MINNSAIIYNIFKNKEDISKVIKIEKGYVFSLLNEKMSISCCYSELFQSDVYLLEFLNQTDTEKAVLASFQKDLEEHIVYFIELFKFLQRGYNETY